MCLSPRRRPPHRPSKPLMTMWFWGCASLPQIDWGCGPQPQTVPALLRPPPLRKRLVVPDGAYAWPTWLTMAVNTHGSRAAAGTMRGASSGWCLAHSRPDVSSKDLRETRRQSRS